MLTLPRFDALERDKIVKGAQETLWSDAGKVGREYLLDKRGIKEETAKKFNLGYVPKCSHQLSNRIIFPIYDSTDHLIALSSRKLTDDKPVYWHERYNKSFYLYGLNISKSRILEKKFVIITEGNIDVLQCHNYGLTNVVGLLGTSISDIQIATLLRYCDRMIFIFDNDENKAGEKAGQRVRDKMKYYSSSYVCQDEYEDNYRGGVLDKIGFVTLTDAKDTDEYIKKFGIMPLKVLIKKALN